LPWPFATLSWQVADHANQRDTSSKVLLWLIANCQLLLFKITHLPNSGGVPGVSSIRSLKHLAWDIPRGCSGHLLIANCCHLPIAFFQRVSFAFCLFKFPDYQITRLPDPGWPPLFIPRSKGLSSDIPSHAAFDLGFGRLPITLNQPDQCESSVRFSRSRR
jgi:hypothetical protein